MLGAKLSQKSLNLPFMDGWLQLQRRDIAWQSLKRRLSKNRKLKDSKGKQTVKTYCVMFGMCIQNTSHCWIKCQNWIGNWKVGYGWLNLAEGQTNPGKWREIRLLVVCRGCSSCCSLPVSKQGDICVRYMPMELFDHILHLPFGHFTSSLMSFA